MPTFSRKTLRQDLGTNYLRDTVLGNTSQSLNNGVAFAVLDSFQANADYSGQGLYQNAYIRVASGDYLVGSFNAPSGAFVSAQLTVAAIASGSDYELSQRLSAVEKNRTIDNTLLETPIHQEVALSSTQDLQVYSIEGVASPHYVSDVLDVYYFSNPTGTLNRSLRRFDDVRLVTTATGREVRVKPAIAGSQQIVLDAILTLTLGSGDGATVNIPSEDWILAGAAARCYDFLIQTAPGQNVGELRNRRAEWAAKRSRLSATYAPLIARKLRFEDPRE